MAFMKYLSLAAILVINLSETEGHGRVMDPVNRGSAFRKGFPVKENWDDTGNYCGGFSVQHGKNGGKCGTCGDDYALRQPRPNENGGDFGRGIIVKKYKAGSSIVVDVDLTANHRGYFTFDLCPLKHKQQLETEECFDAHKLQLVSGGYKYPITTRRNGKYLIELRLPRGLTCDQCVLRWQYTAGNNVYTCPDHSQRVECGPQETFRTCSDIKIE